MKKIVKNLYSLTAIMILAAAVACNPTRRAAVAAANSDALSLGIESGKWKFIANEIMPQYGEARHSNGDYDVRFGKDTVMVYLPYFGKADGGANLLSEKGPLDFTSTNFTVDKKQNKKGQWLITFTPKDYREVSTLNFTLSATGYATLSATMSNRTGISFSGTVVPIK